jgi:hypothetical protein
MSSELILYIKFLIDLQIPLLIKLMYLQVNSAHQTILKVLCQSRDGYRVLLEAVVTRKTRLESRLHDPLYLGIFSLHLVRGGHWTVCTLKIINQ